MVYNLSQFHVLNIDLPINEGRQGRFPAQDLAFDARAWRGESITDTFQNGTDREHRSPEVLQPMPVRAHFGERRL
jgi:hypothetical protein